MASPYSSGGGGTHFESRVVAYYLAAILSESPARAVPGQYAVQALTQQAAFDEPLDDIIVSGLTHSGERAKLHLQIKSDLKFTRTDRKWVSVLRKAWDTFRGRFDGENDRLGVAVSTYSSRADKHYQSVLNWAAQSVSGQHFVERIEKRDYSHKDKRSFIDTVQSVLGSYAGEVIGAEVLWRFLRCFVILPFDFMREDNSRDTEGVLDRLRNFLPSNQRKDAAALWDHLVARVGELIPAGGGATRETLVRQLHSAGKPTGTASSWWQDLEKINQESQRELKDIKSDIQGLHLHRREAYKQVKQALANTKGRFIQIDGEPGTGKSALLRDIAQECNRTGPILVLKDSCIQPRGWASHAHALSVRADAPVLLRELGTAGAAILFIDGIDKITDPAVQRTVNDLVRVIAGDKGLAGWKILATVREQNLDYLATWLDPDALSKLPMLTVTVKRLDVHELSVVSERFPRIKPLLLESGGTDVILQRPFFLDAILSLSRREDPGQLPASEVELLKLWWNFGGSDRPDFSPAQHRRNVLLNLAERLTRAPNAAISIKGLEPEPLENLRSAGVLRDKELGHSVIFTHDIYEEWALGELLIGKQPDIVAFLREVEEPQALVRPMQLLGTYVLEENAKEVEWKRIYERVSDATLRPVWQRAMLTSCIRTTRAEKVLAKLSTYLVENEYRHLKRLLVALRTIEVVPNLVFLNEKLIPDLDPAERVQYANAMALPKPLTWVRFLNWFMVQPESPWPTLIPDLLPVFQTWQNAYAGRRVRHCRQIGEVAHCWLVEFEVASHPDRWKDRRDPFGIRLEYEAKDNIEESIRSLFLNSAGDVPHLVSAYLKDHGTRERKHIFRDKIMSQSSALAKHVPAILVDYILEAFLEHPAKQEDEFEGRVDNIGDYLGIADHQTFFPASPAQPPFLILLREHEAEGLRLIRGLCNHSIAVWKWVQQRRDWSRCQATPVPIDIVFPWGAQKFWGNGQVYLWFRGIWGNSALGSALMALEQWAFEQMESGKAFEDIFRKVIEGNDSVAALGLAASLCIAHPDKSIACALPLVSCPNVWKWDIFRVVQDRGGMPSNEIGDWHRYGHVLGAVRVLNARLHRQHDIRALVPYFVFHRDPEIKNQYVAAVRRFTEHLPFEFEEEHKITKVVRHLQDQMQLFVEQADPEYWKAEPTEDGKAIKIWNDPPSLRSDKHIQESQQHDQLNDYAALSLWAEKSLRENALDSRFTPAEGLAIARPIDATDLFDQLASVQDIIEHHRQAAVAGTAFVVAHFYDGDNWHNDIGPWCFDVLQRAATAPEADDDLPLRSSVMSMHPVIFAAHGYASLLSRGYKIRDCELGLLNLAVDAASAVVAAVAASAQQYAVSYPSFYWVLFNLLIRQCIVEHGAVPNSHSMVWDEEEAEQKLGLLYAAERLLETDEQPTLPEIPMPWIERGYSDFPPDSETGRYERNASVFLWHLAEKAVFDVQLDAILPDAQRRRQFVRLVGQLVAFTIQEIIPPFAQSRGEKRGNTPFEWVFAVFNWLGRVSARLTLHEVKSAILDVIFATDDETAQLAMQSFMPVYMIKAFLPPAVIDEDQLSLWNEITAWVFENGEGMATQGDYISREYTSCALATLFCVHGDFGPLVCGAEEGWTELRRFIGIIERAVRLFGRNRTLYMAVTLFFKKGGFDLLPAPGLAWLREIAVAMKPDQEFWRLNGEETVEIMRMILRRRTHLLSGDHRKTISYVSDILVDNGVRGAGFLQQELLRVE